MKSLLKLGFRRPTKTPTQQLFEARKLQAPMKPDVNWHPDAERQPQAPHFTGMWLDEWANIGNIKNPLASPMESGS
jgi:hypothetical protein